MGREQTKQHDWPHAPAHRLGSAGAFMVTAGTYQKQPFLNTPERRDDFLRCFFSLSDEFQWRLQAWAVLSNHYHFIALTPENALTADSLKSMLKELHRQTSRAWNIKDGVKGRRVWYNYWESHITFERSYFARLKYVHNNPVHHGVTDNASNYRWCSKPWLENHSTRAFVRTLESFKTDRLNIFDDF